MSAMKTPGVYVVEKNAFPNSVVEVSTAVPAFIGYTEFAKNGNKSLTGQAFRVTSLAEYVSYFGGPPRPEFELKAIEDADDAEAGKLFTIDVPLMLKTFRDLASAIRKESEKGVSDAKKAAALTASAEKEEDADKKKKLEDKLKVVQKTADDSLAKAFQTATAYAGTVESATLIDLLSAVDADTKLTGAVTTALQAFPGESGITAEDLDENTAKLMAAIDEFIAAGPAELNYSIARTDNYNLYYHLRFFFANGGGTCYIVSVGSYKDEINSDTLIAGIEPLLKEQEPTMVLVPEAVYLPEAQACYDIQTAVLKHCGNDTRNRIAVLDVYDGFKDRKHPDGDVVTNFREKIGTEFLDFAAAYYPWLETSVTSEHEVSFKNITAGLEELKNILNATAPQLKVYIDKIGDAKLNEIDFLTAHKALYKQSAIYAALMKEVLRQLNLLPPASAMAGIYTLVDHNKEVWKAPANIGLSNVIEPSVNVSFNDQNDLNVPLNGKSINAIRYFVGEGVKVWGARTLDGNSLDWRYINVRRTMIMLEESIKNAAKAFVFEPNVANTWVSVRGMINSFLNGIWKRGGLAGSSAEDAFSVHIGLGDTMTPDDILEGIMRITVLVAISRPAEFIEITFQQQMQKS